MLFCPSKIFCSPYFSCEYAFMEAHLMIDTPSTHALPNARTNNKPIAPLTLTDAAVARILFLLQKASPPALALRLAIKTKGCSGHSYDISYAYERQPMDEVVTVDGASIFIDSQALLYLIGTQMDWQEDKWQSGFVFTNPLEKGRCGCGESFHV
jgi:iron-sulfur cluster assembly protein